MFYLEMFQGSLQRNLNKTEIFKCRVILVILYWKKKVQLMML